MATSRRLSHHNKPGPPRKWLAAVGTILLAFSVFSAECALRVRNGGERDQSARQTTIRNADKAGVRLIPNVNKSNQETQIRELLGSLIQYHESQKIILQDSSQNRLKDAVRLARDSGKRLIAAIELFRTAPIWSQHRPFLLSQREMGVMQCEECIVHLRFAVNSIAETVCLARMATHHRLMKEYYAQLLSAQIAQLPPLPAAIAAERLAIERELQRTQGLPKLKLLPEPPPHLLPDVLKPRPHYDPGARAGRPGGPPESW